MFRLIKNVFMCTGSNEDDESEYDVSVSDSQTSERYDKSKPKTVTTGTVYKPPFAKEKRSVNAKTSVSRFHLVSRPGRPQNFYTQILRNLSIKTRNASTSYSRVNINKKRRDKISTAEFGCTFPENRFDIEVQPSNVIREFRKANKSTYVAGNNMQVSRLEIVSPMSSSGSSSSGPSVRQIVISTDSLLSPEKSSDVILDYPDSSSTSVIVTGSDDDLTTEQEKILYSQLRLSVKKLRAILRNLSLKRPSKTKLLLNSPLEQNSEDLKPRNSVNSQLLNCKQSASVSVQPSPIEQNQQVVYRNDRNEVETLFNNQDDKSNKLTCKRREVGVEVSPMDNSPKGSDSGPPTSASSKEIKAIIKKIFSDGSCPSADSLKAIHQLLLKVCTESELTFAAMRAEDLISNGKSKIHSKAFQDVVSDDKAVTSKEIKTIVGLLTSCQTQCPSNTCEVSKSVGELKTTSSDSLKKRKLARIQIVIRDTAPKNKNKTPKKPKA